MPSATPQAWAINQTGWTRLVQSQSRTRMLPSNSHKVVGCLIDILLFAQEKSAFGTAQKASLKVSLLRRDVDTVHELLEVGPITQRIQVSVVVKKMLIAIAQFEGLRKVVNSLL